MSGALARLHFISPEALAARLGDPDLRVIDGSWHLPPTGRDGRAEYLAAHLPGAVFFDLDALSDQTSDLPHMLPRAEIFGAALGEMGLHNDHTLVVYDQSGLFSAARVAWMLALYGARHVAILEGGLPRWRALGLPVTDAPSPMERAIFTAHLPAHEVASLADVQQALAQKSTQIVDARPAARFRGEAPEPRPGVRSGHIPGSCNLPFDQVVAQGALADAATIQAALAQAGIDPAQPVITTCGSGVSALLIALALHKAGVPVTAVYDGAWAEWGARADLPLATGPAV